MRIFAVLIAGLLLAWMPSEALVSDAVDMDAGPGGAKLAPVWVAKCPDGEYLAGLRIHEDGGVAGVRGICVPARMSASGMVWAGTPRLLPEPPPPPPPVMETIRRVVEVEGEGTILRASSSGVTRERSSRALIITIKRPVKPAPEKSAASGGAIERITFRKTSNASDVVCPADRLVTGLRMASHAAKGPSAVRAVQIICGDGRGHDLAPIGSWVAPEKASGKKRKRKRDAAARPVSAQRIDCGLSATNPHDGIAARAVFGTEEGGRIATMGLSCSSRMEQGPGRSRVYAALRVETRELMRALNWSRRVEAPKWIDGAGIAVCDAGKAGRACARDSADAYCTRIEGFGRSSGYVVGRYAQDAVTADGQRCKRGACRVFASVSCAL
jgi:hypothetical protein